VRVQRASLGTLGFGTIAGRLYDLGAYPGVVLDGAGSRVRGELLIADDDQLMRDALHRLDRYEGCRSDDPPAGLYRRETTVTSLDDGAAVECFVYVYNRDLSRADLIVSGCWLTHTLEKTK
jgi:gamma-glutamylcyclotransferase (GGCT)/AIG2-like uncharacterized protein YtfP